MSGLGAMFTGPPKQKVASPQSPPPDPDEEGPVAKEARRRKLGKASQRSGRTSTILTGDDYSAGALG